MHCRPHRGQAAMEHSRPRKGNAMDHMPYKRTGFTPPGTGQYMLFVHTAALMGQLLPLLQKRKAGTASGRPGRMHPRRKGRSSRWRTQRNVRMRTPAIPCLMNPGRRCTPGRQRSSRIWCGYPSPTLTSGKALALTMQRPGNIREPALSRLWRKRTAKAHPGGGC